jgi:hypothetical protein
VLQRTHAVVRHAEVADGYYGLFHL